MLEGLKEASRHIRKAVTMIVDERDKVNMNEGKYFVKVLANMKETCWNRVFISRPILDSAL